MPSRIPAYGVSQNLRCFSVFSHLKLGVIPKIMIHTLFELSVAGKKLTGISKKHRHRQMASGKFHLEKQADKNNLKTL